VPLLREALERAEAPRELGPRLLGRTPDAPTPDGEPFGYAIGLGTRCFTSAMLRRQQLRAFSSPFDWIFSSPGMITHCLRDDFRTFLAPAYYEAVPPQARVDGPDVNLCDHVYYRDHYGVRFVFNHTDPNTAEGYAYFERCVGRLRRALDARSRPLLVCVMLAYHYEPARVAELFAAVRERNARAELLCVVVEEPQAGALLPALVPLDEVPGVPLYRLHPVSALGGVEFADPIDELPVARLVRRQRFDLQPAPPV